MAGYRVKPRDPGEKVQIIGKTLKLALSTLKNVTFKRDIPRVSGSFSGKLFLEISHELSQCIVLCAGCIETRVTEKVKKFIFDDFCILVFFTAFMREHNSFGKFIEII